MTNTIYNLGALAIAGTMIFTALHYSDQPHPLSTQQKSTTMIATVSATTFAEENTNSERTIIDVRTPEEYAESHIAGAVNINSADPAFETKLEALAKDAPYSVYCRSGNRSGKALRLMEALGFSDVVNLDGGVIAWQKGGNTLCTDC